MHRLKTPGVLITIVALLMAGACGEDSPPTASPTPTPSPGLSTEVVPGEHIGTTEITFLSAEPAPGSTLTGCGSSVSGCSGRVQMRFRFLAPGGAAVSNAIGYLHATNKSACFAGSTGALELQAGVPADVVITFGQPDDDGCDIPATIANMKVVLSAGVDGSALQEWGVQYEFLP